jgi:heme/copper-type cytochrome/quinol oxidase subunit 2
MEQDIWDGILMYFLVILVIILTVIGLFILYEWLGQPADSKGLLTHGELPTILEPIGAAIGGLLLAINAVLFNKRAKAQIEANEQDLFKAAIEHLGARAKSVRLGGSYELRVLAKKKKYQKITSEILGTRLRGTVR